jgi:hypothetical protein
MLRDIRADENVAINSRSSFVCQQMRVGNFRTSDFEKLPKLVAEIFPIYLGKTYSRTNAYLKTTARNNVSVLDFIMHYLLHVSAPIGGHLQAKCTQNILR